MTKAGVTVVIGSGVGGLVAAGRLAQLGEWPIVLERQDRLGGRFSTEERDGFRLPTGAIAIETSGPFYEAFQELGIVPDLRLPDPPILFRVKGRELKPGAPVWDYMMKKVTKSAGKVAEGITESRGDDTDEEMSLAEWAQRYTRNKTVLSLFESISAAIFTVNADELPARAFFRHLRETGAFKRIGFAPRGNIEIANAFGEAIQGLGGEVRRGWTATAIELDPDTGDARAVHAYDPAGESHRIEADAVFSNVGPYNTAALVAGTEVADQFKERIRDARPTSMMVAAFSSDEELLTSPGLVNFTDTRRLCSVANLAKTCPELAPPGRTLYEAYACPRPSVGGDYDQEGERALMEEDLHDQLPGYENAELITFKHMRGTDHPAQQVRSGDDLEIRTPVSNLFEVGDGVKPYGWIGTTACAHTGREAVAAYSEGVVD